MPAFNDVLATRQTLTSADPLMRLAELEDCITADVDLLNARRIADVRDASAKSNLPTDANENGMLRAACVESWRCLITDSGSNVRRSEPSGSILWSHGSMTSIEARAACGTDGAGTSD